MCKILFNEEGDFHSGALILVDKPLKWTSFDVVNKIRWCLKSACGKIKVGHAGTLDPLATGLVIVCTGKWTKRIEDYMAQEKEYVATLCYGAVTPSFDLETLPEGDFPYRHIDRPYLDRVLERFRGVITQVPPAYSAIRVDGDRAYKKARKGNEIEMPARQVVVNELEIIDFNLPDWGSTAAVGYRTESMHGAGSPQAQRIMISRQGNLAAKKELAKVIAKVDESKDRK